MAISPGSLDANVLLRLLINDVKEQHDAVLRLLDRAKSPFTVADTALIEVAFVLERYYELNRLQILEAMSGILALPEINCNRRLFEKSMSLFAKHTSLSLEDCCLAIYAELDDAKPLWTFDKKLANHALSAKLVEIG